jgi:parallel beta-helix repeat protein
MLAAAGCGGSSDSPIDAAAQTPDSATDAAVSSSDAPLPDAGCPTTWSVDGTNGSDAAAGTCLAPFKTITHALSVATSGHSIRVTPGSYSAATGETIPIAIPSGVALLGDEANKGRGATATTITGHASIRSPSFYNTAVTLGTGATIAGFNVVNDDPATNNVSIQIWLYGENNGIIRNNTLDGSGYGVVLENNTTGTLITGNVITNHAWDGIDFNVGGMNAKVENNVITGNQYGVEYASAGGDLGGGSASSAGGNTISCNTKNDIWTNTPSITISAKNNKWDHATPTTSTTNNGTTDIYNGQSVPLDTTGATATASACP